MIYASVCDGIGAAHAAWQPIGWRCAWTSEIEPFPAAVVHHRWGLDNRGDMTSFREWDDGTSIDLLAGGTPCQSFSVAGLRKGLRDPRGGLMLTFIEIAERYRPRWIVWENVPGVLSSNGGRDFGSFVGALGHLGYGWAYRILDAQWFGVPQRRRRVFVVGCIGSQRSASTVLFNSESVSRDNPPRRQKGQGVTYDIAPCIGASGRGFSRTGETRGQDPLVPVVANTLTARMAKGQNSTCDEGAAVVVMAFNESQSGCRIGNVHATLDANNGSRRMQGAIDGVGVRRLTPRECERLQGFPDDYTAVTYRNKPAADGPRYKALGNSMAVPVMRWIGNRISLVGG